MTKIITGCYSKSIFLVLQLYFIFNVSTSGQNEATYDDDTAYKVFRIIPTSTDQLQFLASLAKESSKRGLNFWTKPLEVGRRFHVMVNPDKRTEFQQLLDSHDISNYTVVIENVKSLIQRKEGKNADWDKPMRDLPFRTSSRTSSFNFMDFHSYSAITDYLQSLAKDHPSFVQVLQLGISTEGRKIMTIQIGKPSQEKNKKSIWIDAGIHAREWLAPTTALYFINELITQYLKQDPTIVQYVEELIWYITPVVNPDGYEYTRSDTDPDVRLWRKSRSEKACKYINQFTQSCCKGVDLNRNFGYHWGETGASDDPCEEIYKGTSAFSEPETRAVRDFVTANSKDMEAFITLHTYSQLWIYPYGNTKRNYPPDVKSLRDTALTATDALKKLYGTKYSFGTGADLLYDASGGSDDWAKSLGIKYVYLIELRPGNSDDDGFIVGREQIVPTGRETWQGVKVVVDAVLQRNGFKLVKARKTRSAFLK